MFRQSVTFPSPISDAPSPSPPQPPSVNEASRRQQQIVAASSSSSSQVKPHPLHNFPLSDLRWAMNHSNTHHRLRKASSSSRSPLREAKSIVIEDVNEASGSSFELKPETKKKGIDPTKSTTVDGGGSSSRSKIFIRIRTKNNEASGDVATVTDSDRVEIDGDVSISDRISDGGGEGDEFGPKTWNLRPRKPPPTKKRSIGVMKSCSGGESNKTQGTVRTEAIRSRNGADAKIVVTERKEKKPRLSISLSKLEIDEDIYALTGSKPSRRPKKRAKNVQKQLDVLFPGLWMGNVSSEAYKVSEHA